jgi:hypothetical protein
VTRDTTESDLKQRRELSRLGSVDLVGACWCWEVVLGECYGMGFQWDVRRGWALGDFLGNVIRMESG